MPAESHIGQVQETSPLARFLGPELMDFEGEITSHEAIQKMLRGEAKTPATETVLDKETAEISGLLRKIFEKLKGSVRSSTSLPELNALFAAFLRVRKFPLPQLNREQGEFSALLDRPIPIETGPADVSLFRFLMVDELRVGKLSPQVIQAWGEFEAVWQRLHETGPRMVLEGKTKEVAVLESQLMNEVIQLIIEKARAISLLEGTRQSLTRKADREVAALDQSKTMDWECLEQLLYFRLAGEWPVSAQGVPLLDELKTAQGETGILTRATIALAQEKMLPSTLITDYLQVTQKIHEYFKTKDPIQAAFSDMLGRNHEDSDEGSEDESDEQKAERARQQQVANELRDKHLRPNTAYTLDDGTVWYWGRVKDEDIFVQVDGTVHQERDGNLTQWYFFRKAIEQRVLEKTEKELQPKIQQAVVKEAWRTLLRLSKQDTTQGLVQWLESETRRVEQWVASGKISPYLVQQTRQTPRENLWQVESDIMQYRSILQGKRSALNVSPLIMEWQSRVMLQQDKPGEKPEQSTLQYLRLMHLLRELLQYDESELQTLLPQDMSPQLLTTELTDKIFELAKGDRSPLLKPEWQQ